MTRSEELKRFSNILFSATSEADGSLLTFKFPESSLDDFNFVKDKFKVFGLAEEPIVDGRNLIIQTRTVFFRDDSIIYSSLDSLWFKACSSGELPEEYVVLRENLSSTLQSHENLCMSLFLKWSKILKIVSNHSHKEKYIIYLPNDDGGKELVIESHGNLNQALKVNATIESENSADELLKILSINDAQKKERVSIIRNSIYDFLNDQDEKNIEKLVSLGERIYIRYNDLLELYTNRFSVNKILSEIEQKNLEYSSKINDFISSSQTKAFAIPGALIAVGGIAKANGFWDSLLIMIGLFYVYYITYMSNQVLDESYDSLKENIKKSFERYSKFDEGIEVKETASGIHRDLIGKIDGAKRRLLKVNGIAKSMLWAGGAYLTFKLFIANHLMPVDFSFILKFFTN